MDLIERVIDEAGGVSALAVLLGVRPPTVYQWRNGDRPVPPRLALRLSQLWPDIVSVHSLRPDVFGEAPAEKVA